MISRAIPLEQTFLEKLFKRKSIAYIDVNYKNKIFLLDTISNKKFKIEDILINKEYEDFLIIRISFKDKYFDEIDNAIKQANDNAEIKGFKINEIYDKYLGEIN